MSTRNIETADLEDAKRLRDLWHRKKEELHLSQVKAAKELGYSSQGAISQYLNGKVAMNLATVAKFAKLLRVTVDEISPRFAQLVENPIPSSLDGFFAPSTGTIGGVKADNVLDWFAFHKSFAESLGVPEGHLKLVRVDDNSHTHYPTDSVLLVDDSRQTQAKDGVYLLQQDEKIVVRTLTVGEDIQIGHGRGKPQHLSKDAFGLLHILARVIGTFNRVDV